MEIDSSRLVIPILPWRQITHTAPDTNSNPLNKSDYELPRPTADTTTGIITFTGSGNTFDDFSTGQLIHLHVGGITALRFLEKQYRATKTNDILTIQLSTSQLAALVASFADFDGIGDGDLDFTFDATPQRVLIAAPDANVGNITIGPNSNANAKTLQKGETYLIEMPAGSKFDLAQWYYKAATANDQLIVIYV